MFPLQLVKYSLELIVILDFDYHHGQNFVQLLACHILGDGTQMIFLGNKRVLFISLHRTGFYRWTF